MRQTAQLAPHLLGGQGWVEFFRAITSAESPYTVVADDALFWVNSSGAAVTFNLPAAADSKGRVLGFVVVDSTNTITIDPNASENIDGAATKTITAGLIIQCDGTEWRTLATG